MDDGLAKSMGIPGMWEGDPKSIAKFLRFTHGQLQNLDPGVIEGEFAMVIKSLSSECERAMRFIEGYAAGMIDGPPA